MSEVKKVKTNSIVAVGELVSVETEIKKDRNEKTYIAGKVEIKSIIDGREYITPFDVFSYEKTKENKDNKLYKAYTKLEGMLNKRVKVTGEFSEGMMPDSSDESKVIRFNRLSGKFFSVENKEEDKVNFEFGGFVTNEVYERTNKEGKIVGYGINVAQANYNDTNIQNIRFHIDKDDAEKVDIMSKYYTKGSTVEFNGIIRVAVTTETREEKTAFGDPQVKVFQFTEKNYTITGGNLPLDEKEDGRAYTQAEIEKLVKAYKDAEKTYIEQKSTDSSQSEPVKNSIAGKTRSASLI